MTAPAQNLLDETRPFAGKYLPQRVLGQGGMGFVFEAHHARLGQRVAIKVLSQALREYPELVQRFEREARAASLISSVHAVKVFDIDMTEDGTPFIVMELLTGRDLGDLVEKEGRQTVGRAARWIIDACDAIAEAHRLGIIHRDIKPSNLFLADIDGQTVVKVLDFGIAKRAKSNDAAITQALAPLGTPQYMSPEQVRNAKDVDARTDIWSLGVSLYELVTGRTPFAYDSSSACIASIAADPVPDPRAFAEDLPEAFAQVIMRALEKDPEKRFPDVPSLVAALEPFAEPAFDPETSAIVRRVRLTQPSVADHLTSAETLPRPRRVRPLAAVGAAALLGLVAIVATPKCVGSRTDAAAAVETTSAALEMTTSRAGLETTSPAAKAEADTTTEPAPAAAPTTPPKPTIIAARTIHTTMPAERASIRLPKAPPKVVVAASTEKHVSNARVHGGLTSPGF